MQHMQGIDVHIDKILGCTAPIMNAQLLGDMQLQIFVFFASHVNLFFIAMEEGKKRVHNQKILAQNECLSTRACALTLVKTEPKPRKS